MNKEIKDLLLSPSEESYLYFETEKAEAKDIEKLFAEAKDYKEKQKDSINENDNIPY